MWPTPTHTHSLIRRFNFHSYAFVCYEAQLRLKPSRVYLILFGYKMFCCWFISYFLKAPCFIVTDVIWSYYVMYSLIVAAEKFSRPSRPHMYIMCNYPIINIWQIKTFFSRKEDCFFFFLWILKMPVVWTCVSRS